MKKKLLFITFLMLFCSTMFGQFTPKYSYTSDGTYDNPMTLSAVIEFDGEEQINPNLELGVFCGDELRGGAFVIERKGRYYARPLIYGQSGQFFTFKVYDHTTGIEREWSVGSTFTYGGSTMEYMSYNSNGYGNFSQPAVIDFVTPNYWNPEPFQFNFQVTAVILKDGVEQTDTNLELGAFSVSDGTVRGSVKLYPQTILGNTRYYAYMLVGGTSGEEITFKLYDHGTRQELQFNDVNTCILTEDDDATGNPILGSYIKPLEVNFITAPYVAQIGENKYLSFDAALEAAVDGDNIELLKSIDLGTTTAVIEESINITLGNYTITGTVELANTGATITGAQNGVTSVITNVADYKVVYEDGMYKLVAKVYVAQVGDVKYESIQEAVANWTNNTTLTLLADVTLSDVVTINSTEHHILNLGTYTMTAASGKNAFVIKACGTGAGEQYAITINADATNPGGINAGSKCVIYYKYADGGISTDDRPIIKINGGVFTGSTSSWGTAGIYTIGTAARKCATLNISGGTFNCSINGSGKSKLIVSGGVFNYSVGSQGDSTCYRLISGGTFNSFGFMTADDNNTKFWIGTSMGNSNVGTHIDDNGYLVVGGPVVTEAGETYEASSNTTIKEYTSPYNYYYYLKYSSAKDNGIYYTSVEKALADNKKESSEVNIYVSELDLTGTSYKGTLVITEPLTVTFAEGTTPAWKVASGVDDHQVGYTESVENGVVTRVYTLFTPVAQVGETYYATLQEAIDATTSENTTVKVLKDINLEQTATIAEGKTVVLDLNGKTINAGWEDQSAGKHIYAFTNNGTLTIKDSSTEADGTINARGIFNYGTMTLVNGTINAIDGDGGYGVRNYSGASFTMNAGTIATTLEDDNNVANGGYDATPVRVDEGASFIMIDGTINNICDFTVAIDNYGTTTIEGGTFTSVHTTVINHGTMTIDGGSFTCDGLEGITAHALWAAAGTTTINGGTFDGKDNYNGFNVDASSGASVEIKGGTFLSCHSGSLYGDGTIAVSGGKFFDPVPEGRCAAGYIPTTNTDGTYGVKQGSYVAQVGEVKYETLEAALEAAKASSENDAVTILKTIVLSETQTIDFENIAVTSTVNPAFRITSGAAVTVKNGNMNTKDGGYNFILGASDDASSYGNLTISSGKYHGATTVASVTRGALTITGGEFSVEPYQGNYAFLINCIDANYKNGTASVAIIGGTFHNWNPQNNAAEGAGTDFCHVDYAATETAENVWTVLPAVAKIGEARFATLQDAVDAAQANETINLIAYVELTTYVTIDKSVNLNLGQFNITRENGTALYVNGENVEVTIDGEGTVSGLQAVYVDNGTVTINGGNYVGGYEAVYVINNGHAVINGGTFGAENDEDDTDFVLNEYDETRNVTTITVYGGTFHGFNPQNNAAEGAGTNFCAEGYGTVESSTGVWEVVPMQGMKLYAGWNWFSSYVDINGEAGWENLKTGLGSNAMLVKNQNSMSQYYNTDNIVGWDGTLEETSVKEMYMIRMSADHDLTLTGKLVDPSENPITLHHNGWTWIGYPMNQGLALEDVLKGFNPNAGDRIKSHQGFSQYYDNELYEGWWGTLETMTPGYGYMYYNAGENNATLKYSYPADGSKSELRTNITSENNYWVPASSQYAGNMNIVAMFEADGDNYEIAAFVGGEVRGSARPIYVEPLDAYMFFLTVHGEDVEEMTFKVYDLATGEEYNLNDRMNYTDNAIVGSITEPYIFRGTVGVGETSLSEVNVYPNPTTIGNEINLGTECDTVEVFNALGVKVAEYQNVDTVDALETAGVYVIRITNDGNVQNCRLIVK